MALTEREQLQETIREARGMVKDLRRATKEAKQVAEMVSNAARQAAATKIDGVVEVEVARGLTTLSREIRGAMDAGVEQVMTSFQSLENVLLHGNRQGRGESLLELHERLSEEG